MSAMTFEKALEKLSGVVSQLESGNLPLEKSMKLYEEGVSLTAFCEQELQKAALRIREIRPETSKQQEGGNEDEE
ncbi:MAG TPA: exodeoxyribonuclease VII small subunit [Candidatus Merdivicinus excrementipullorum]|uniref:Exodeoxyribonuclease 7 small subunit n=1 Tax=Candidatus Merdivicinus excrementipullorum TaxID=2840867 RepID=A0A9D1FNA5_9FIRM|nr:exodeoxyribonuclease VII small subunit [Candidatus Merdivicinus excrementipullorum]